MKPFKTLLGISALSVMAACSSLDGDQAGPNQLPEFSDIRVNTEMGILAQGQVQDPDGLISQLTSDLSEIEVSASGLSSARATFTLKPKGSLPVGELTTVITATDNNGQSTDIAISFTATYRILLPQTLEIQENNLPGQVVLTAEQIRGNVPDVVSEIRLASGGDYFELNAKGDLVAKQAFDYENPSQPQSIDVAFEYLKGDDVIAQSTPLSVEVLDQTTIPAPEMGTVAYDVNGNGQLDTLAIFHYDEEQPGTIKDVIQIQPNGEVVMKDFQQLSAEMAELRNNSTGTVMSAIGNGGSEHGWPDGFEFRQSDHMVGDQTDSSLYYGDGQVVRGRQIESAMAYIEQQMNAHGITDRSLISWAPEQYAQHEYNEPFHTTLVHYLENLLEGMSSNEAVIQAVQQKLAELQNR